MPRFEPFVGLRYDPTVVHLDQVIAPPYDVIEPPERARLAGRHAANAVHVELPEADLRASLDRYQVAAQLLADWQAEGIVRAEPARAFYPYRMITPEGARSTGVIGALGIDEEGDDVLPHEETMPKPKSDRYDLLAATRANLSPIWGLSLAPGVSDALAPAGPPVIDVLDDDGVRHQLWVQSDPAAIAAISGAVGSAPVVVADGHHRYETARRYRRDVRAAHGDAPGDHDLIMAFVVELSEDQLTVGPIHRALSGLPPRTDLPAVLASTFEVVHAGDSSDRVVSALGESQSLALITAEGAYLLLPRPGAAEAIGSDLDSSLVSAALEALPKATSTHKHSWQEALASLRSGEAEAVLLLRPVTVAQIAGWAEGRRRMPPKTTYFSPKPRTGMVFRILAS
ncbi:MAG TPA: DUF1015 domain-containing protein [Acidimicrobiales bacterium]|nr:DUF1015 domain-containing protein [Acidimicrobiales bacterium]